MQLDTTFVEDLYFGDSELQLRALLFRINQVAQGQLLFKLGLLMWLGYHRGEVILYIVLLCFVVVMLFCVSSALFIIAGSSATAIRIEWEAYYVF